MTRQIALCVVTVAALSAGALAQEPAPTEEAPAPAADPEELAPPAEDPASPPSEPAAAAPAETLSRFTVLSENDKFAGTDRFYTNGLKLIYQRDDVGRLSWGVSDLIGLIPKFGSDIKKKGGAVGLLTNGLITRNALYAQPLIMALIPFIQPELWE